MHLTRRGLLAAGALLPLAACTSAEEPEVEVVDPDVALRAAAVTREQALIGLYDEALRAVPGQALWAQLRADHAAHLARLLPPASTAPSASPTSASSAPPAPAGSAAAGAVAPPTRAAVGPALRRQLLTLSRSTAREHAAAVPAASRDLAAVLASLAACESSHAVLL